MGLGGRAGQLMHLKRGNAGRKLAQQGLLEGGTYLLGSSTRVSKAWVTIRLVEVPMMVLVPPAAQPPRGAGPCERTLGGCCSSCRAQREGGCKHMRAARSAARRQQQAAVLTEQRAEGEGDEELLDGDTGLGGPGQHDGQPAQRGWVEAVSGCAWKRGEPYSCAACAAGSGGLPQAACP